MNFKKIIAYMAFLLLAACGKTPSPLKESKPLVLVSIAPYQFLVEKIAGSDFEVQTVVPAATNPHAFEPKATQVTEMAKGTIWFQIGEPFETKIAPILTKNNPNLTLHDLRDGIAMIEEESSHSCKSCSKDHLDRHIWLSPKLASEQSQLICNALSEKFPEKKELFKNNLATLNNNLEELNKEIEIILKPLTKRTILVSHPAFGYFCKEYNFTQISVEFEGKDPRPKHLEEILERAIISQMETAIALPQYNNKGTQVIANKLHVPIHLINPYSSDYFETMRRLAKLIAQPNGN